MSTKYIVRGLRTNGDQVFYTGRAGEYFVHPNADSAFTFTSLDSARFRATNMNKMTALHGIHFIAIAA